MRLPATHADVGITHCLQITERIYLTIQVGNGTDSRRVQINLISLSLCGYFYHSTVYTDRA